MRQGRAATDAITVGIDVSKDRLDVAVRPGGDVFVVERNAGGLEALVVRLKTLGPLIIALEASGGFETVVTAMLAAAGLPVTVVNPAQVRAFAKAIGQRAKTDPIDAVLAEPSFAWTRSPILPKPQGPSRGLCPMPRPSCWLISWPGGGRSSK